MVQITRRLRTQTIEVGSDAAMITTSGPPAIPVSPPSCSADQKLLPDILQAAQTPPSPNPRSSTCIAVRAIAVSAPLSKGASTPPSRVVFIHALASAITAFACSSFGIDGPIVLSSSRVRSYVNITVARPCNCRHTNCGFNPPNCAKGFPRPPPPRRPPPGPPPP